MPTRMIPLKFDLALTENTMFVFLMLEWITRRMFIDSVICVRLKFPRWWQATVWLAQSEVQ